MNRIDRDDLRREQEADEALEKSFTNNPIKAEIQELFHNEFSGAKYRKYTVTTMKKLIKDEITKIISTRPGPYSSGAANLRSKINKATTVEEMLTLLNEYLFS